MSNHSEEERSEVAWSAIKQFQATLKEVYSQDLNKEQQLDSALIGMLTQHQKHLDNHVDEQSDVDPYKIVCWYGCCLLQDAIVIHSNNTSERVACPSKIIAKAMVNTLNGFLYQDSHKKFYLSEEQCNFLVRMLMMEKKDNKEHGIWQNGLYSSFYAALAIANQASPS